MNKSIIKKQAEEKLQQLKDLLQQTDITAPATHSEVLHIIQKIQEAQRILTVYEYLLSHTEISTDINVHLKIMEVASEKLETKEEIRNTINEPKENIIPVPKEPVIHNEPQIPVQEVKKPEPEKIITTQKTEEIKTPSSRKLEIGINDKYRMINDLFSKSQQEFSIAIEQINSLESWPSLKQYLDSLADLYKWDPEKDIVKTLYRLSQKRFL